LTHSKNSILLKVNKNNQIKVFETFLDLSFPWLMFALGIWFFCLRILGFDFAFIPGDMVDSRFINYVLEHVHRWVSGSNPHFWDAGFMFPFQKSLALSDNMLGAVTFYSIWRWLGFEMETSFQLWWLTVCILNYWTCFIVLRKLKLTPGSASLAAWIFAFGLFNLGQLNHMQMMLRFAVPVIFYSAYKLVNTGHWRYYLIYLTSTLFQLSAVLYTGIYAAYFSILFIIIYAWHSKQFNFTKFLVNQQQRFKFVLSSIAAIIGFILLMQPYQQMASVVGLRLFKEVLPYLPQLRTWLFPHEASLLWQFMINFTRPESQAFWLLYAFPGIIILLTMIGIFISIILFLTKRIKLVPLTSSFLLVAFIFFILHLRVFDNYTLYAFIFKLPGINSIRIPLRFMHVELFLLVFIFGLFINNLKFHYYLILGAVLMFDNGFKPGQLPRVKKSDWIARREFIRHKLEPLQPQKSKPLVLIDTVQIAALTHLDAMVYTQQKGLKSVNGYSGYCHDKFGGFFNKAGLNELEVWLNYSKIDKDELWIVE